MRQNERDKRNYIIGGLLVLVLFMTIGFAAFRTALNINGTASITSNWCVGFDNRNTEAYQITKGVSAGTNPTGEISFSGTACSTNYVPNSTLTANFYQPGDKIEYTLTIANKSSMSAAIESIEVNDSNVTSNQTITDGNIIWKVYMPEATTLASNATTTMKVSAEFQNTTDISNLTTEESSSLTAKINVVQDDGNGGLIIEHPITANSLKENTVITGNGLYVDTAEGITRYIYKGDNSTNNYIYIKENGNNVKYRIYSIESDGTMKVIRDEAVTNMAYDIEDATRRKTGYCIDNNYCNAWAAMDNFVNGSYSGTVAGINGNSGDSSIKEYIEGTYASTLDDYSKIVTKTWNISGTKYRNDNLENIIIDEKKSTWNGKIALLTASEYIRANSNVSSCGNMKLIGNNDSTCSTSNYLFNSTKWWLITPSTLYSSSDTLYIYDYHGTIDYTSSCSAMGAPGVRPSFYLCSGLTYSGKGTSSEPYYISGGNCTF